MALLTLRELLHQLVKHLQHGQTGLGRLVRTLRRLASRVGKRLGCHSSPSPLGRQQEVCPLDIASYGFPEGDPGCVYFHDVFIRPSLGVGQILESAVNLFHCLVKSGNIIVQPVVVDRSFPEIFSDPFHR